MTSERAQTVLAAAPPHRGILRQNIEICWKPLSGVPLCGSPRTYQAAVLLFSFCRFRFSVHQRMRLRPKLSFGCDRNEKVRHLVRLCVFLPNFLQFTRMSDVQSALQFDPFSVLVLLRPKSFGRNTDFVVLWRNTRGTRVLNAEEVRPLRPFSACRNEKVRCTNPISLIWPKPDTGR